MTSKLRKYKYTGWTTAGPGASSDQSTQGTPKTATSPNANANPSVEEQQKQSETDMAELKSELLLSIKKEMTGVLKEELKNALAEEFNDIKTQVQGVKEELASCKETTRKEIEGVKATVKDLGSGLSTWSDEVVTLQAMVTTLKKEVTDLIDRSHRSLLPPRPGGKPRAIIAKLHYYQDCVEVLRQARNRAPLMLDGQPVSIFPDFTPSVARARASFTGARKLLRDQPGVRFGILYPARFRITHNGEEKEFVDAAVAEDYIKKRIIKS